MGNSVMLNGIEYAGEQIAYKDSTYELVSKVAYLIGVPLRIFQNEHEPPKIEIYNRLERDKNARIIRNLCIIRTAIERNYRKINVKAKLFCPEIAGLFCRIAGLFCHDSRANLSLKPVCFGIAIS